MCGIFGTIGATETENRLLSILNTERGSQSFGLFADGVQFRSVGSIRKALSKGKVKREYLDALLFLGHTRAATTGDITLRNCHPFEYDNILGAHNGIIYGFHSVKAGLVAEDHRAKDMQVDSEVIFLLLDKFGPEAMERLTCYAGCWWLDKRQPGMLNLWCWDADLSFCIEGGKVYFSSDKSHLRLLGCKDIYTMDKNGEHAVIDIGKRELVSLDTIKASARLYGNFSSVSGSGGYARGAWLFDEDEDERDWLSRGKTTTYRNGHKVTQENSVLRNGKAGQYIDEDDADMDFTDEDGNTTFSSGNEGFRYWCPSCGEDVNEGDLDWDRDDDSLRCLCCGTEVMVH